jgi:hypothetical protein
MREIGTQTDIFAKKVKFCSPNRMQKGRSITSLKKNCKKSKYDIPDAVPTRPNMTGNNFQSHVVYQKYPAEIRYRFRKEEDEIN